MHAHTHKMWIAFSLYPYYWENPCDDFGMIRIGFKRIAEGGDPVEVRLGLGNVR